MGADLSDNSSLRTAADRHLPSATLERLGPRCSPDNQSVGRTTADLPLFNRPACQRIGDDAAPGALRQECRAGIRGRPAAASGGRLSAAAGRVENGLRVCTWNRHRHLACDPGDRLSTAPSPNSPLLVRLRLLHCRTFSRFMRLIGDISLSSPSGTGGRRRYRILLPTTPMSLLSLPNICKGQTRQRPPNFRIFSNWNHI